MTKSSLVVVGAAALPLPEDRRAGTGPVHLYPGADLPSRLVDAVRAAPPDITDVVVVTVPHLARSVAAAVRFCRQALRVDRVRALVVDASPFRTAVVLELHRRLESAGAAGATTVADRLEVLRRLTAGVVAAPSVFRLRSPAPRPSQRMSWPRTGHVFAGPDVGEPAALQRLCLDGTAARQPWDAVRRVVDAVGDVSVWVAPAPRELPVAALVDLFPATTPVDVVTFAVDPGWWEHRGAPVTELVVVPRELERLGPVLVPRDHAAWRCYWCRETCGAPGVCPRCGADGRAADVPYVGAPAVRERGRRAEVVR